ncbi:hypothetical protein [Arthrobacter globiformis]|uniref:hypothetical protein n=1 Tax=Arthrobacter globiformis TaxID=1665 RepID=UPI000B40F06D|nr:hypothetical protein [Arthrobacter globiformis]
MTGVSLTVDRLLRTPGPQLDELFRQSPSDRTPAGDGDGTVIFAPGSPFSAMTAGLVRLLAWKGKTFDPGAAGLRNRMGPLGKQAIPAKACHGAGWLDANPAIILDYSRSALVARRIRDEIREVAPGVPRHRLLEQHGSKKDRGLVATQCRGTWVDYALLQVGRT